MRHLLHDWGNQLIHGIRNWLHNIVKNLQTVKTIATLNSVLNAHIRHTRVSKHASKLAHRQTCLTNIHTPCLPIDFWLHMSKKVHAQNRWHSLLKHIKSAVISIAIKRNLQRHLTDSFKNFTIRQANILSSRQIPI
jgi:hypothetical protein